MRINGLSKQQVSTKLAAAVFCVLLLSGGARSARAQTPDPKVLITAMINNERASASHEHHMEYVAVEKSERTGGHAWTERVVETSVGRVRFLLAEDGKPLSPERVAQERGRLAQIVADPSAFEKSEAAQKDDEGHARQMLEILERGFLLENLHREGTDWRMDFRPDPNYSPSGMEERVLHGMSGWIAIDAQAVRLHHVEGRMPQNVSIGFGILATVHTGSHFVTTKAVEFGQWRTVYALNAIDGKAALFKTLTKNQEVVRSDFRAIPGDLTPAAAVSLAEQP